MIKLTTHFAHICLLAVLLLTGFVSTEPVTGAPTPEKTPGEGIEIISSSQENVQVSATREWTMAELQSAKPYPVPQIDKEDLLAFDDIPQPTGPAGIEQGSLPLKTQAIGEQSEVSLDDNVLQELEPEVPYWYGTYPFSTVGQLFFIQNGERYACSAAVIKNQSIWTGGHCTHAGDGKPTGWSTNVVFIPQYRDGVEPLGQWIVEDVGTILDWYINGWPDAYGNDMGVGILSKPIGGRTGWLGFAWNQPFGQSYTTIGYPGGTPYDGQRMRYCPNRNIYSYDYFPEILDIQCYVTVGWSGGPWITNFSVLNAAEVNDLNSKRGNVNNLNGNVATADGGLVFSPYFDDSAKVLYDITR